MLVLTETSLSAEGDDADQDAPPLHVASTGNAVSPSQVGMAAGRPKRPASRSHEESGSSGFLPGAQEPSVAGEEHEAAKSQTSQNPWAPLIEIGLQFAERLASVNPDAGGVHVGSAPGWIETDRVTGKSCLKVPLPDPADVERLAGALRGLLAGLRR